MLEYRIVPVTPFQQNCSLIWCSETRKAAIVDPGGDLGRIRAAVADAGVTPEKILLTHGHIDHAGATAALSRELDLPIEGPQQEERFWIDAMEQQGRMFGFPNGEPFEPTRWLEDGDQVTCGGEVLDVLHCPGHTPGHVVFFSRSTRLAIVGDVLFAGSIGRTDFPRGDMKTLLDSIRNKLWPLGDDVAFIPGHGPMSTIGEEKRSNPFVNLRNGGRRGLRDDKEIRVRVGQGASSNCRRRRGSG
ncbi:MAG: MBL fold metallo-hydrolase [Rhodocyclaceae bacterium]|nr:MBL fold metallo-hydrolase [Rhodocyclaceae bacterium]